MIAAPSAVDTPLTSRHLPLCRLTAVKVSATPATGRKSHSCWLALLQVFCCCWVPSAVLLLGLCRHSCECCATAADVNSPPPPPDGGSRVRVKDSSTLECGR